MNKTEQLELLTGKRAVGRPKGSGLLYTPELADAIVAWISAGGMLSEFCRQAGAPSVAAVNEWRRENEEFGSRVARAREDGFDMLAEESLRIADDGSNDWMERNDPENPGYELKGEHIQRSKLRADQRLKLLACWDPRRYGPKQQTDVNVNITLDALVSGSYEAPIINEQVADERNKHRGGPRIIVDKP